MPASRTACSRGAAQHDSVAEGSIHRTQRHSIEQRLFRSSRSMDQAATILVLQAGRGRSGRTGSRARPRSPSSSTCRRRTGGRAGCQQRTRRRWKCSGSVSTAAAQEDDSSPIPDRRSLCIPVRRGLQCAYSCGCHSEVIFLKIYVIWLHPPSFISPFFSFNQFVCATCPQRADNSGTHARLTLD